MRVYSGGDLLRAHRAKDARLGEDLLEVEVPRESNGLRVGGITHEEISKCKKMHRYR